MIGLTRLVPPGLYNHLLNHLNVEKGYRDELLIIKKHDNKEQLGMYMHRVRYAWSSLGIEHARMNLDELGTVCKVLHPTYAGFIGIRTLHRPVQPNSSYTP